MASQAMSGQTERFGVGHARFLATVVGPSAHVCAREPFGQRGGLRADRDDVGSACVSVLLLSRGPVAIGRFVVAVVLAALDAMRRRWASSHVFEEGFELHPTIADSNPSRAIVRKVDVVGVCAAALHAGPCAILRRLATIAPFSVPCAIATASNTEIAAVAAARLRSPTLKCSRSHAARCSAITSTDPSITSHASECGQTPESNTGKV